MKKLFLMFFAMVFSTQTFAQTAALKQQTDWLTSQLNRLVINDDDKGMTVNDKNLSQYFRLLEVKC